MARYTFLDSNGLSLDTIFAWAKRLITDLNSDASRVSGAPPIGSFLTYIGATAPDGWLLCDGATYSVSKYPQLSLVLGATGDSFTVPDMRDKMLMGAGTLVALGATAGAHEAMLAEANLAAHSHVVTDPNHTHAFAGDPHTHGVTDPGHSHTGGAAAGTHNAGGAASLVAANTGTSTTGVTINNATATGTNTPSATGITLGETGSAKPFSVLNPVFGVNVIIKA